MRPLSIALSHNTLTPPMSEVPLMMTSSIAENIIIVWITSVHTTAFKPPCEAEEKEEVTYSVCPGLVVVSLCWVLTTHV